MTVKALSTLSLDTNTISARDLSSLVFVVTLLQFLILSALAPVGSAAPTHEVVPNEQRLQISDLLASAAAAMGNSDAGSSSSSRTTAGGSIGLPWQKRQSVPPVNQETVFDVPLFRLHYLSYLDIVLTFLPCFCTSIYA